MRAGLDIAGIGDAAQPIDDLVYVCIGNHGSKCVCVHDGKHFATPMPCGNSFFMNGQLVSKSSAQHSSPYESPSGSISEVLIRMKGSTDSFSYPRTSVPVYPYLRP